MVFIIIIIIITAHIITYEPYWMVCELIGRMVIAISLKPR